MSRFSLRQNLARTFLALALFIALLVTSSVLLSVRLLQAERAVVETLFDAVTAASDLNQGLLEEESAFRGFALTGEDVYLDPYRAGRRRQQDARPPLVAAEEAYPQLRTARLRVASTAGTWRTKVAEPGIARVRAGEPFDAADLDSANAAFDRVQVAIADYRALLLRVREDNARELNRDIILLFGALGLGLVLLVAFAALIWVSLRRWVIRPLDDLGVEVLRVEDGDLDRQVVVERAPGEIAILADRVDRMRSRLRREYVRADLARGEAIDARTVMEEQAEDLRRSNTELEQFAYVASHDLQEPLRKVASFCQLLERRYKGQLDERGEQYIDFAVDGAKRMQQLINDLLMFSRVGRYTTGFQEVDLEEVLAQALRQLDTALEEADAVVTHDPLPTIEGEATLLVQLLQNLIGNGVKFRREDEAPRVHVSVARSAEHPSMWEFTVSDNGIGIDEQYQDKIFVIFQRLHVREAYGGTGIGLAMCKKIVEYHGGRLWLDTTRRDTPGSVFRWTLPEHQPQQDDGDDEAVSVRAITHQEETRDEPAVRG